MNLIVYSQIYQRLITFQRFTMKFHWKIEWFRQCNFQLNMYYCSKQNWNGKIKNVTIPKSKQRICKLDSNEIFKIEKMNIRWLAVEDILPPPPLLTTKWSCTSFKSSNQQWINLSRATINRQTACENYYRDRPRFLAACRLSLKKAGWAHPANKI